MYFVCYQSKKMFSIYFFSNLCFKSTYYPRQGSPKHHIRGPTGPTWSEISKFFLILVRLGCPRERFLAINSGRPREPA